jgi:hypothetical protein
MPVPEPRRPSFSEAFPRTPELDALVDAFALGNYARVRAEAPALDKSDDETVRAAARTLVERTQPDPLAVRFVWITAALLLVLAGWWVVYGKAPPNGKAAAPTTTERVSK